MVELARLERVCAARYPGFESLSLRHEKMRPFGRIFSWTREQARTLAFAKLGVVRRIRCPAKERYPALHKPYNGTNSRTTIGTSMKIANAPRTVVTSRDPSESSCCSNR